MEITSHLKKPGKDRRLRNSRSYSVRKYKGYPRIETSSQKSNATAAEQDEFGTIYEAAGEDLKYYPICSEKLAESRSCHYRTSCAA